MSVERPRCCSTPRPAARIPIPRARPIPAPVPRGRVVPAFPLSLFSISTAGGLFAAVLRFISFVRLSHGLSSLSPAARVCDDGSLDDARPVGRVGGGGGDGVGAVGLRRAVHVDIGLLRRVRSVLPVRLAAMLRRTVPERRQLHRGIHHPGHRRQHSVLRRRDHLLQRCAVARPAPCLPRVEPVDRRAHTDHGLPGPSKPPVLVRGPQSAGTGSAARRGRIQTTRSTRATGTGR